MSNNNTMGILSLTAKRLGVVGQHCRKMRNIYGCTFHVIGIKVQMSFCKFASLKFKSLQNSSI